MFYIVSFIPTMFVFNFFLISINLESGIPYICPRSGRNIHGILNSAYLGKLNEEGIQ